MNLKQPQTLLAEAFELQRQNQFEQAEKCYAFALSLNPAHAEGWYFRGLNARAMMRDDLALDCLSRSLQQGYEGNIHHLMGLICIQLHREEAAIEHFQQAITQKPGDPELHVLLATTLITQKKITRAAKCLNDAISLNNQCYEAYRLLAKITPLKVDDPLTQSMLNQASTGDKTCFPLHFGLAEIFAGANDWDKYWQHLHRANQLQLQYSTQSMAQTQAQFKRIKLAFNHPIQCVTEPTVKQNITPIFIVGLPRSGTTLVEQILASHPAVYAGDELPFMRGVIGRLLSQITRQPFPLAIDTVKPEILAVLAQEYLSRAKNLAHGRSIITDKNPENFFTIGVIATLFPTAKIIRLQRDPMDICFSLYNQCTAYAVPYFNDLSAMADFVLAYQDLMTHWDSHCRERIYDIQYENLVNDPAQVLPDLFDHCGLEWRDDFLNFYSSQTTVRSLTSLQVRQPIHRKSVGAWKVHQNYLQPLLDKLT